jgi:2-polyprenyl-3-methyl-5-hydroxy-6-metoxy-1,4-benzoquinol methylase
MTTPQSGVGLSHTQNGSSRLDRARDDEDIVLELVGTGKKVLEIGCGSGSLSRRLTEQSCRVTGLERDPVLAADASKVCAEVIVADPDTRSLVDILPRTTFDVLVIGEMLFGLREPWRVLDEARTFMAHDAFAVLSVPNMAHGTLRLAMIKGELRYPEGGLPTTPYLRLLNTDSVKEFCLRAGFDLSEVWRTKVSLFTEHPLLPEIDPEDFDGSLIEHIRADEEHDTLRYIFKARALSDEGRVDAIVSAWLSTREELRRSEREAARLARIASFDAPLSEVPPGAVPLVSELAPAAPVAEAASAAAVAEQFELLYKICEGLSERGEAAGLLADDLRAALAASSGREAATAGREAALVAERAMLREQLALHTEAYQRLIRVRDHAFARCGYLEIRRDELVAERTQLEESLAAVRELADRRGAEITTLCARLDGLRGEVVKLEQTSDAGRRELAETRHLIAALEGELAMLRAAEAQYARDRKAGQVELGIARAELSDTRARLAATERTLNELAEGLIEKAKLEVDALRAEATRTDRQIQEIYRSPFWKLRAFLSAFKLPSLRVRQPL